MKKTNCFKVTVGLKELLMMELTQKYCGGAIVKLLWIVEYNIDAIYMVFQIILWYYQDKCPNYDVTIVYIFTFIFMHLADAFIQSDLQVIHFFLSVPVFPGNWTHNLCAANAMLYHWATGTHTHTDGRTHARTHTHTHTHTNLDTFMKLEKQ